MKFGGTRPESDPNALTGTAANVAAQELSKERKHRHQRSAGAGMPGGTPSGIGGPVDVGTPKPGSMPPMAPPEVPFGAAQPPAVSKCRHLWDQSH